uniref:Uncharacterized protein n=1 Tax=Chromera velia CCMP2878 TaxID=1169474 RepID=A0A0G4HKP0_9ALVE|eukprot:Cvel_28493.t1-p1 / transcript=Cvel_28493.t1 / gene=Cvel_28493 / organism=Chromera_velia_CCMP2878 / gene_product=hypothetical protein / transcript_product=hypothetical protein / location=Cvel_scaffold3741:2881-5435(+) / protein_length=124 / sequence_SO=supercontig / SO=protein_coding / is_pseudo=false
MTERMHMFPFSVWGKGPTQLMAKLGFLINRSFFLSSGVLHILLFVCLLLSFLCFGLSQCLFSLPLPCHHPCDDYFLDSLDFLCRWLDSFRCDFMAQVNSRSKFLTAALWTSVRKGTFTGFDVHR